jgi:uncharacterized protein YodC (DUF2158 family)
MAVVSERRGIANMVICEWQGLSGKKQQAFIETSLRVVEADEAEPPAA